MTAHVITLLVVGALTAFSVYRRFRRSFGRQRVRERAMMVRIILLAVVCALVLMPPFFSVEALLAAAGGAVAGVALGILAVSQTAFEITHEGKFYTPHLYIGLGVSALFIGRLVYRLSVTWPAVQAASHAAAAHQRAAQMAAYQHTPLTVGLYFLLAGYYIWYYIAIIRAGRRLEMAQA